MTPPSPAPAGIRVAPTSAITCVGRFLRAFAVELHARADIARDADADEEFAGAGGADAADAVLRVGAGADDGRIADAAPAFAGGAAGGGAGGDVAVRVERDDADGAELVIVRRQRQFSARRGRRAGGTRRDRQIVAAQIRLELLPAALGEEVGRIDLLRCSARARTLRRPRRPA